MIALVAAPREAGLRVVVCTTANNLANSFKCQGKHTEEEMYIAEAGTGVGASRHIDDSKQLKQQPRKEHRTRTCQIAAAAA